MAQKAYYDDYAKRKKETDKQIEEAMKAREERNSSPAKTSTASTSSGSYYAERKKELDSQVNTAMAARSKRIQSSAPDIISDIRNGLTVEIDSYNKTKKPSFGSYTDTYSSQRERRLNISSLRSKVKAYRSYMKDVDTDSILSLLDDMEKGYDSYLSLSKFESEEDYNQWEKETKEYETLKNLDIDQGEREVKDLEKILDEYKFHTRWMTDENGEARAEYIRQNYGDEEGIKALISKKKQDLNRARHIQEGITLAGVIDNDDFKESSGYVSTKSDDTWKKLNSQFGMGYDDLTYEYINGEESGMRQEIINKAVSWDYDTEKFFVYDHMTEDQISTYNYYYAKDGKEAADKYLNSIQETLNYQAATQRYEKMEGKTALEMIFGFEAGIDQFQSGIKNLFNTEDDYIPQSSTQMVSGMVREDLADNGAKLPDWLGGASIAQAGYDAITTTANMVPSIMTSTVMNFVAPGSGAVVGTAMMGASAAGNAYQEMLNLGYDKSQARAYSTLVGASEAGLQYLLGGIGSLGGKLSGNALTKMLNGVDNAFLRTALKLGGNMLSEGLEEGLQEVLTPWFQNLIMNTDEDINWSEVAYSTLLGALTAGFMEGPSTISGEVSTYKTGKQLQNADISATRLAEIGKTFSADTVAYQLAGKVNENTGAYTMGRLFNEIGATLSEQNVTEITNALVAKGMDQTTAKKNAEALAYVVEGGQLSDTQIAVIEGNEVLAEVARATLVDANTTWNQRTHALKALADEMTSPKASRTNPAKQSQDKAPATGTVDAQNNEAVQSLSEADTVDTSPAKVQTISNIANGQVTVKLEDGTEINVKEADLSVDDGVRIETIAKLEGISAMDANFILNTLRTSTNASAQMDSLGAREAYKYGFYGFSPEHMTTHGVFANSLTESQRKAIYETGRSARQKQVDAKQATVSKKESVGDKKTSTGKVHFEGDRSTLKERQRASLTAMEKVAEVTGTQIYVFKSYLNENGKRVYIDENGVEKPAPNGWYDPKDSSIHIDLSAGNTGEGTMLFTLAHELTHHIRQWSPAKFKVLADFLMQEYGKKGVNVDALVREQQAKAKRNKRHLTYDEAFEEVVADSMEMMLADGNVMKRLEKLKAQDKDLWHKIKSFIDELAAKIKAVYKGMAPDSVEGRHVADMGKAIYRLQELFAEGLVDASENFQSAMETVVEADAKAVAEDEIITDGAVVTDGAGKKYSLRSMKQDIAEGQMFEDLKTYCGWTQKQVNELRNNLADLVEYMTPYRDILDMNETYGREGRRFSPYKPNSDPLYKISMDFSTLCSKRLLTQYVIENLQLRENRPMSAEEQMAIRDMLNEYRKVEKGLQVACAMCYVEAARLKSPKQITKWMEDPGTQMKNYFADKNPEFANFIKEKQADFKESRGYDRNATKKDMSPKDVRELNKIRPRLRSQYQLSAEEAKIIERVKSLPGSTYLTAGNLASLSETDPAIYAAYTAFVRTATRSKSLETDEPYYYGDSRRDNGNGIIVSDSFIEAVNRENGMRFSSWSDWRIQHLLDYIAAVIDNSVRGAAMHGYTKFGEEVRVLGKTGMMFNMSGVAGTQTGLNEDGSLSFSPTESIDVNEAIQLREEFPDTAGLQCIGVGDDHIIALLRSDIIDYVIPYHVSGLNAGLRAMANIHGWKDYTSTQHAAIDKSIKFENAVDQEHWHEEPVYSEFFVGYDTGMTGIEAMRASADRYVQMCKDRGLKPKFEQFVNEDNYWKLLIDRKMVNQKTGKLIQQKPVTPTFDFDTVKSVVDQFVQNYDSGLEARALNHIVENWDSIPKRIRDLKKQGSTKAKKASKAVDTLANQTLAAQPTVMQSARDLEAEEISDAHVKWSLRDEAPPKKTKIGYKAFFVKDGKLYPPMVANPSGAGTPVGVWLNADTGSPMRDSEGNIVQNKSGRAKVAAGGKGTKGGGGSLAWRPGWHLGPIPDATQFSVDPASKEWSEWLSKSGRTAGESKNIGNNGNPIFLNPHIVFAEVEFAADVDYQLEAYEYGVKKNGKFDHSQAGIPYVIKDGYYRYRTNSMAPGALSWYITGAMKVNRILTDAECREICAKSGRDMMPRLGGDFDFVSHSLTPGNVTSTEDLSSVAPKQDFSDEVLKLPGYVRRKLNFSDPNFRKAFEDDSIADMVDYYEDLYNKTDALKFSDRDSDGNQLSKEQSAFFAQSKVRDENGNLMVMYHGTNTPDFTVFDPQQSDDHISLFFTSDPDVANTYTQLQDKGRDVDPYNLITKDSSAEQFNKAQERVGGGLRVVKITPEWIQEMKAKAEKSATRLFGVANKLADLLAYNNSTGIFNYDIERIRDITGKGIDKLKADDIYKLRKAMGDAQQHSFFAKDHKGAEKEIRRTYSDNFKLFDEVWNYKTAASTPDSAIGQYTYTETNSSVPFMVDRNLDFLGQIIPGTEREMVAKALDRMNWVEEHHLGNRYKVYLNITNPYIIDAGVSYSGKMDLVSLERSTFGEGWRVSFENAEHDVIKHMTTTEFNAFIESAFDANTTAKIKAQIEADNEAYRKEWGDDFYEDMDVGHDIQLRNVNMNYTEAGNWNTLNFNGDENAKTRDVTAWAKANGYDGVIFKNMKDAGGYAFMKGRGGSTVVTAFSSEQVKSVDNKNPTSDPDIRFSYRDRTPNAFNPDGKTLDEQLDEILDTAESFDGRYLYIGRFTHTFIEMVKKYVNIEDLPIAMNYRDAYLSMESKENGKYKGDGINYHNIGKEGMKSAIESFDRPEQVLLSKKDGKIELVLEGVDRKGNRLLSIVALNTSTRNAQKFIEAHIVTSIYGKRSIERYVSKAESEGRLIYTKKEELAQGISQVQYEGNINANSSFETTIAQTDTDVKMLSDRDSESVSNRSLLANAFEGVAQNDIEKQKIQEYKGKISLIEAEERKLQDLNQQIKDLSFAKGPKDTKAIRDLQFEAKQTANRISTYDKQLLRLEASKPLQDVLTREKKMAYQRAEKKGKDALEAYREKTMKTQRELIEKWQDSRKKGIESRQKTAMRHKIKDVVNELNQYLLRGTKDRHVPIELQKAVAEALDAVNMDTVGADERIAKLQAELLKAKTPEKIQEISRKIDHIREMGDRMNGRLKKLKDAYDQFVNSDDPMIADSHDEVISNKLQSVIESVGDTPLRDMTVTQLEDVYDMYRMVLTTIRNTNKAFKAKKSESISVIAGQVMMEVEKVGGKKKLSLKGTDGIKGFFWNNLKPVYAFEHIGSDHFTEVFNNVRAGEDVWALDVTEAREFYLDKSKKHGYDSWDFKKRYKFTSTSGMDFELDLEQIMSLYAYSKREQAADHLKRGGIVIDESTKIIKKTKLGISLEFNPTEATAYNISDATLAEIISKLTADQKDFVDVMQDYLSTVMGAKGNEVSLEMYGVKLFKEKFYFPLKSAQQFMAKAKEQQKGEVKIKNSGFSKETVQKASNPIVLTPFMNVWADHVNEMSMYHAFVLPMEDFYRVYNYKTPTSDTMATESVEMFIQNAYGKGATKYIDQLLKDLNGGARTDHTTGIINKMMGLFKKGAVFASLSVVVQQPSAIARAAALVDTKYFIGPKVDHKRHKVLWDEVKQYAPVAVIKEMGYFDTNMGKSTQDFILGKEYSGFKDKMKALFTDSGYRDEALSKAPALADEIAWCSIWEAVKRETKAKYPGLDTKAEPFLKLCGSRFTEVIVKTQVYDSVLSRSGLMRSKDTGMKMATAFMAEPTTSINMISDALLQGKRGNRKYARGAIGAVIASQILNSILVSFVYAGRDDDEDETYLEKYIGTLSGEILDSLNPAGYIPFIKDIMSIVQGYDVERSDMAVISDLWKAWENLSKDYISPYRKVEGFAGSIAQIFGLPVKNIMRDARGIYQTIDSFVNGQQTTKAGIGYAVKGAITGKTVANDQQLYEAILSGDQTQIARVKGRYADEKAVNTAMRSAIKEHFLSGDIDSETAMQYMVDYCGDEEDEAFWKVEEWTYDQKAEDAFSKYNEFYGAVQTGKDLKAIIKKYTDNGVTESTLKSQISEHFKKEYIEMSTSERASIKGYLLNAMTLLGDDREDAEKRISGWEFEANSGFNYEDRRELYLKGEISGDQVRDAVMTFGGKTEEEADKEVERLLFEAEYGFAYSDRADAYKSGEISAEELKHILMTAGGKTAEEADLQVQAYDWEAEGYEDVTSAAVRDYAEHCAVVNVPKDVYLHIRSFANNTDNDVDMATGKTIYYSAMKKIMAEINAQYGLTNAQKDALARSMGWAEKNIQKYKLW